MTKDVRILLLGERKLYFDLISRCFSSC